MSERTSVRTTCNRDCPDACGMVAEVEDGRVVSLRGDKTHPVTRGFLCFRTSRFLERQYSPERITMPLLKRGDRQVEIPWDEALDLAAEKLLQIRRESGPAAIFHYRSGGSLGMLKMLADHFFERFGPVTIKRGDICSGAGDAAQEADFGIEDSNDVFDLLHARHIIDWGKNLHVSNVHLLPIVKEAKAKGASFTVIDPAHTRTAAMADDFVQVRPGGDAALALAVMQRLFERGAVSAEIQRIADHVGELRGLAFARSLAELCAEADVTAAAVERLAERLADGPTTILIGWGLGRRLRGSSTIRLLDALSVLSGNIGRKGGGASFYFKRRGAFDVSFIGRNKPPRTISEPMLGAELPAAQDPPVRALWVTAGNPVAMLPDSAAVARAIEGVEFSVVVDAFPTDTTRRASLVFPTTTLLEDDDVIGAYGHHYLGVSRPAVPPPAGVLTELELLQALAARVGLTEEMAGTARDWKRRMLNKAAPLGASLEALEAGPVKSPFAKPVLFDDGFGTENRRANLIHALPAPPPSPSVEFPLSLLSSSTENAQSSQWAVPQAGLLPVTVHPDSAAGLADGATARLVSPIGAITVSIRHDPAQRRDVVLVPKGGHYDRGWSANAITRAQITDGGEGAAYLDTYVRLEAECINARRVDDESRPE